MSEAQAFATHIVDLLESFGRCEARRMFGGYGIFHQGLMFALIADGELYLKADDHSRDRFESADCDAFVYYKKDRPYRLSYYRAPDDFFEDETICLDWARTAYDAALRNPPKRRKKAP